MFKYPFKNDSEEFLSFSEGPFKDVWFKFGDVEPEENPEESKVPVMSLILKNEEDLHLLQNEQFLEDVSAFVEDIIIQFMNEYKQDFDNTVVV